jgi:exodeoxyribonuclease VII small subunit
MAETKPETYEQKSARLESILKRLDNAQTPIDELAADVKVGVSLIIELTAKLHEVETGVADAFAALEAASAKPVTGVPSARS